MVILKNVFHNVMMFNAVQTNSSFWDGYSKECQIVWLPKCHRQHEQIMTGGHERWMGQRNLMNTTILGWLKRVETPKIMGSTGFKWCRILEPSTVLNINEYTQNEPLSLF